MVDAGALREAAIADSLDGTRDHVEDHLRSARRTGEVAAEGTLLELLAAAALSLPQAPSCTILRSTGTASLQVCQMVRVASTDHRHSSRNVVLVHIPMLQPREQLSPVVNCRFFNVLFVLKEPVPLAKLAA
eukprot:scaffold2022_cov261-Pinguiococcus_pyrenoidosus.AAC.21